MSVAGAWDDAAMHELRVATRECAFDWARVAERVSAVRAKTTAAECRDSFARDFAASDASDEISEPDCEGAVVVPTRVPETFQDLMLHIEAQEEENLKRKERIFERVLQSLGGAGMTDSVDALGVSAALNEVQLAFYEALALRQAEKTKRERRQLEAAEQELLSRQRLDLQKRFDEGSADSVGIPWDPNPRQASMEVEFGDVPAEYFKQLENFRIDDLLESAEFDSMLASIEEDLNSTAGAKEDADSELSEVLRFLDESATRWKKTDKPKPTPATTTTTLEKFQSGASSSNASPTVDRFVVSKETAQVYLLGTTLAESTSAPNLFPPPAAPSSDTLRTKRLPRILPKEDDSDEDDDTYGDDQGWAQGRAAIKNRAATSRPPPSTESFPLPPPSECMTQIPISEDDDELCVEAKSGNDELIEAGTSPVRPTLATHEDTADSIDPNRNSVSPLLVRHDEKPVTSSVGGSLASSRRERGNKRGIMNRAKVLKMQTAQTLQATDPVVDVPTSISSPATPFSLDTPSVLVQPASPLPSTQELAEHELMASFPLLPSVSPSSIIRLEGAVSSPSELAHCLLAAARSACRFLSINHSDNSLSIILDGDKSGIDPGLLHLQLYASLAPSEEGVEISQCSPTSTVTQSFSFLLHSYMIAPDHADALQQFLLSCEKCGIMLVGARTAYVTAKRLTTQHRRILNSDMFRQISDDGAEKMLIILAFTGPKNVMLDLSATEMFRDLLGPDDPTLAKKTDPTSVRARYGISREQNVGVTIPITPHNIRRDLQFWFGSEECAHSSVGSRKSFLSPSQRLHTAVFVFEDAEGLDSMRLQNSQLSVVSLCHQTLRMGFAAALSSEIVVANSQIEAVTGRTFDGKIAMALVVTLTSFAGEECTKEMISLLARGVELLASDPKYWPIEFVCRTDFKMESFHPVDNSLSSHLSKMDPLDFGSHFSTGLPDVVTFLLRADAECFHLTILQQREFVLYELAQSFLPGVPSCILAMGDTSSGDFAICVRSLGAVEGSNEVAIALNNKLQSVCLLAKVKCAVTIRLVKGLSCCEMICSNFLSRSRCFTSLALREAQDLVPGISSGIEVLFPPFEFMSCGIIFIPISTGRLLSRVLKRMERLSLDIQALEVCALNERCLSLIADDATRIYGLNHAGVHERFQSLDSSTLYFAVLLSGNSVLSTLKNTVGPPDFQLALSAFPKSLVGSVADYAKPDLFATLTVPTSIALINHIFQTDVGQILASKPLMIGVEREQFVEPNFLNQVTRIPHDQVFQLVCGRVLTGVGSGSDAALFVVTHALISEIGLSTLFDSLARESFVVVYLKSSCLDGNTTRRVLDACGHSSLSMKPSATLLTAGPCLFVAVDGPAGSLSRIQSLTLPNSRDILWKLKSGEWGVAGSSSARIAREMFQFL